MKKSVLGVLTCILLLLSFTGIDADFPPILNSFEFLFFDPKDYYIYGMPIIQLILFAIFFWIVSIDHRIQRFNNNPDRKYKSDLYNKFRNAEKQSDVKD